MLKIKKMLGIIVLSVTALALVSGCTRETITEEELVNKVVEAYQRIETVKFDMDMTAKTELQVEEITNSFKTELQVEEITDNSKMIATGSGVLDNVNKDLYMKINKERYFFSRPTV